MRFDEIFDLTTDVLKLKLQKYTYKVHEILLLQGSELASHPQWRTGHDFDLAARPNGLGIIWGADKGNLIFVFLLQRAPLAPLWPFGAPTRKTYFSSTYRRTLFFFSVRLRRARAFLFQTFALEGLSLNMYEHVAVEHLTQAQHSKTQSDLHDAAKQVRADQSATTQASKQS